MGGWGELYPSLFWIFGIVLTLQSPLGHPILGIHMWAVQFTATFHDKTENYQNTYIVAVVMVTLRITLDSFNSICSQNLTLAYLGDTVDFNMQSDQMDKLMKYS